MKAVERALQIAEAQIEEAEATARIRMAFSTIVVSNAHALFGLFTEHDKRNALTQALKDKNTDSSMLHRGLIIQVNGIFENFVRSICEAVLVTKSRDAGSFFELEEQVRNEYIHHSANIHTHAKEGNVRGSSYDFDRLKISLARCIMGKQDFEIRSEVFTLLMGNCTSSRLSRLFESLCLTGPFDNRIGNHPGLKKVANERSKRKVAKFAKKTLDEQINLRNEIAHWDLTKTVTLTELQFSVRFFKEYMGAIALNIMEDLKAQEEADVRVA